MPVPDSLSGPQSSDSRSICQRAAAVPPDRRRRFGAHRRAGRGRERPVQHAGRPRERRCAARTARDRRAGSPIVTASRSNLAPGPTSVPCALRLERVRPPSAEAAPGGPTRRLTACNSGAPPEPSGSSSRTASPASGSSGPAPSRSRSAPSAVATRSRGPRQIHPKHQPFGAPGDRHRQLRSAARGGDPRHGQRRRQRPAAARGRAPPSPSTRRPGHWRARAGIRSPAGRRRRTRGS